MSRMKHQGDPNGGDSTESGDENENSSECIHANRAVNFKNVKCRLHKDGLLKECLQCKELTENPNNDIDMINHSESNNLLLDDNEYEFDMSLWMCLRCGNQACGRDRHQHALKHYKTPHSDCHAICVNTTDWRIWCYECDNMVNSTCRKKLQEAFDYLQRYANNKATQIQSQLPPIVSGMDIYSPSSGISSGTTLTTTTGTIPKSSSTSGNSLNQWSSIPRSIGQLSQPRGLFNLGNTCFFNSVIQCLTQTPYLLDLLCETSKPGQHFRLPGGKLNPQDPNSLVLEPLEGELEPWRQITSSLAETINQIQNGRAEPFSPRLLLNKLIGRMPQFGGGDQHDAHELLRHLLEAVREEDLRRYQSVILEQLGYNTKTDPSTVEGDKKKIIKFYGQQASELLLPTEQVFRGVLISTLQCQDCQHTSHRDEYFLDLSLPISEKQVPPVLRRKADDNEDINNKPSKHQIKKEKRAERKKNKKQKSLNNRINNNNMIGPMLNPLNNNNNTNNITGDDINMTMDKSDSESDADVEDNLEVGEDAMKGMESGYNSDKNSSPDSNNRGVSPDMRVDDSGVPSPAIGMLSASHGTPDNSPASSETNIDMAMGSPLLADQEDDSNEYYRPESRLSFVNKTVDQMDLSKLSLLPDGDSTRVTTKQTGGCNDKMDDDNYEEACAASSPTTRDEKMEEDDPEEYDLWTNTISARYQCEEGEYSVQSCLNQFTACELMTGNNKVTCELCTKRHGGSEKKPVLTNATKQLLIYNPPAVLILHLKRFQVFRFRSAKVSKMVKFPTVLDLAPFCSKRSQNLPTFDVGQTKVLYSLYGVVVHSGSIHGGHYVAYVKVRPKLDENSYRWQFLPKNQKQSNKPTSPKGALGDPEIPQGKWYYISDSHVAEASEEQVLGAQAYLLFYERIM